MSPRPKRPGRCPPATLDANGRTVTPAPQTRISRVRRRPEIATTALVLWFLLGFIAAPQVHAQTLTVFYSFAGYPENGVSPFGGLVMDPAGNLYGVTQAGGSPPPFDGGTVFKLDPSGNESVLHSFTGGDGSVPYAGLVIDPAGNLYGTTLFGGSSGYGTVFKLDPAGPETVLHSFTNAAGDGGDPFAGLLLDTVGNLYGTTEIGGAFGYGTVFKLDPSGTETVLYSFTNAGGDGAYPLAGLVIDPVGNLYGTTDDGGSSGYGTVFKLDSSGSETVLHSFTNAGSDGAYPFAGLVMDTAGNLYGTTVQGGASNYGTVFKLDPFGTETLLHSFAYSDGAAPVAGLVIDPARNLYGTAHGGGPSGNGVVFKLDPSGTETVLHSFTNSDGDGGDPEGGLVMDPAGNLYGTTFEGGSSNYGTLFKLTIPVTYNSLIDLVNLFVTKPRVAANLVATLERAQGAGVADNKKATDHQLHVFIRQVSARSGKSLTTAQATILIQQAKALMI
jgi:uncharacterized repeat protein (TIGR03803 family)